MNGARSAEPVYDVAVVVEGCYPFVVGGVSSWLDWLFRQHPEFRFAVTPIVADDRPRELRYAPPENVDLLPPVALHPTAQRRSWRREPGISAEIAAAEAIRLFRDGAPDALAKLTALCRRSGAQRTQLTDSRFAWEVATRLYAELAPAASFSDFFWAWRALMGGLFSVVTAPLPQARVYHAISTGYAGLMAARAALETGRPAVVTEHGIYTNERRIDVLMADWIRDSIDAGLTLNDDRMDVRHFWTAAFEAFARVCYASCARITTLYEDNQPPQRALGAVEPQLLVIANGVDHQKFAALPGKAATKPPTLAMIGRVAPIKDVKTFIAAVARARRRVADLRAYVLGPTDEDPGYFEECRALAEELDLDDALTFTGKVDIRDYLPKIDVVVLTSISEAQPLVLLEAGAAGIPCIATNVGSCREIIEGRSDETPPLGRAGRVVDLMDIDALAASMVDLLTDETERRACGSRLRARVEAYFGSERSAAQYRALYAELAAAATEQPRTG